MESVQAGQAHDASRLINKCLGNDRFKGNKKTAYGLANEDIAAAQYRDIISQSHWNFKLTKCGLLLSETYGFYRGHACTGCAKNVQMFVNELPKKPLKAELFLTYAGCAS